MEILPYKAEFAEAFEALNLEWLETYFYVEDYDREVLSKHYKYIIEPGGHIFSAVKDNKVYGVVALMRIEDDLFELTKMAVSPEARGQGIGQQLMQYCIDFAKSQSWRALLLYSNRKLENAIHIYRKYGFEEIEQEKDVPYERSNIKMLLRLT